LQALFSANQNFGNVIAYLIFCINFAVNFLIFIDMLDIKEYFCPKDQCRDYGLRGIGNLVKAGTYIRKTDGVKKQMLKCCVCGHRFSETQSTIFAGCHYSDQTIKSIIVCISEGNGIRATARILGLSKDRVNKIVLKAGQYAEMMLSNLLRSLQLNECQMDELWSFVNKKNFGRKRTPSPIRSNMDMGGNR
jgi:transposase-like protein